MKNRYLYTVIAIMIGYSVSGITQPLFSLFKASKGLPHLYGKKNNTSYLYTTAGDRLYAIGDQAGNFPAIGFHVPGEMGGVWQQPIKLLDGFRLKVTDTKTVVETPISTCDSFITFPFTTSFIVNPAGQQLSIIRTQFVPDAKPVLVVEYAFINNSTADKNLNIELAAYVNLRPVWLGERSDMIDSTDEVDSFDEKEIL
ncbi:MAG: hypothetical protein WKG06_10215 [Segetibacter sp.]